MQFKIFEDLVDDRLQHLENLKFERIPFESNESVDQFLDDETKKQAVLLYCTTEFKDYIQGECVTATYIDEFISPSSLRSLDEPHGGRYRLLITDSPTIALRGLEYRSYNNGILFATM